MLCVVLLLNTSVRTDAEREQGERMLGRATVYALDTPLDVGNTLFWFDACFHAY